MVTEQQIKELAYAIWEKEDRPEGKALEHYFLAKQMLEQKDAPACPFDAGWPSDRAVSKRLRKR
jgi:hypothetical protein